MATATGSWVNNAPVLARIRLIITEYVGSIITQRKILIDEYQWSSLKMQRCRCCSVSFQGRLNRRYCSSACRKEVNRNSSRLQRKRCVGCDRIKCTSGFYRDGTTFHEICNRCSNKSSSTKYGCLKLCALCGDLPHRVRGFKCKECGTLYAPDIIVQEVRFSSNWDQDGFDTA